LPVPGRSAAAVVATPDCAGPGCWAGAPSALFADGELWLAYRLRRPEGLGRGGLNVLARSVDGERFETVLTLDRRQFGAASLERPALVVTPPGTWRLYVSCATPGSKHWRIDLLEAGSPEGLADAEPRTVFPGDDRFGVKDPVLRFDGGSWHGWICCHPLDVPGHEDRMLTRYATSADGAEWEWAGDAMSGRAGTWDARGARLTAVLLDHSPPLAYYDGRATSEENFSERTGIARGTGHGAFAAVGDEPIACVRYVESVTLPDGRRRLFYEAPCADGSHELRTELAV
jgi:hypothetical protein